MPNRRMRRRPRTSSRMSTVSPSTTFSTTAVVATGSARTVGSGANKNAPIVAARPAAERLRSALFKSMCAPPEEIVGQRVSAYQSHAWSSLSRSCSGSSADWLTECCLHQLCGPRCSWGNSNCCRRPKRCRERRLETRWLPEPYPATYLLRALLTGRTPLAPKLSRRRPLSGRDQNANHLWHPFMYSQGTLALSSKSFSKCAYLPALGDNTGPSGGEVDLTMS